MKHKFVFLKFPGKVKNIFSSVIAYNGIYFRKFFSKLLLSYYVIIFICILSMGILSYSFVSSNIKAQSIKSNDKLLNQFKNTVDSLILSSINDLSLKVLHDTYADSYLSYYFTYSMENNIYGMVRIQEYCNTMKTVNPMLYSVGIYFEKNQLLISNEGAWSTLYDKMSNQQNLLYYYNLIINSTSNPFWYVNHNFKIEYSNYTGMTTSNIIHMIRKIPVISQNPGGAIIISINEEVFYNLIKKTAAQDLDKIVICDDLGSVISHTDREQLGKNITDFTYGKSIIQSLESQGSFITNLNGIPSIVSFCTSEYNDWKYITITPIEKYNSSTVFLVKIIVSVALASIVVGIFISFIPAFKLSNPIRRLVGFCIGMNKNTKSDQDNEYKIIQSTIENLAFNMKEQEQKFNNALPVLKENFLQSVISGQYTDINELKIRMQMLDLSFPHKYFCTLTFKNTIDDIILSEYVKISISTALELTFNSDSSKCFSCEKNLNTVVIINFDMDVERIYELLNSLNSSKNNELTKGLYFSLGMKVEDILQIGESYLIANEGLKYHYIFPEKKLILADEIISRESNHMLSGRNLVNSFITSLRKYDRNETFNALNNIVISFRSKPFRLAHIMECLSSCVAAIDDISAEADININDAFSEESDIRTRFSKIENIIDYKEWITKILDYIFDCLSNRHSEINREMVQKAIEQIKKDINSKDLSLKKVAESLYISQSHLSRIFKNETGITFIDYVTNLKLEYSKDLLINTTMKIDEIAAAMGYSTSHYFISRFRLKYACTPKDFRCKYSGSNKR